jgi:hypothetical protein
MEIEVWKPIEGYEDRYEISNLGRVKSLERRIRIANGRYRVKKQNILKENRALPYTMVHLSEKPFYVHRLVANAFCDNPCGYNEVNHKNENIRDNRAVNLEWCDHKYNCNYGTRNIRQAAKLINGKWAKSVVQLTLSGEYVATFPSVAEVHRQLGFSKAPITCCCRHYKYYTSSHGYMWMFESEYKNRKYGK